MNTNSPFTAEPGWTAGTPGTVFPGWELLLSVLSATLVIGLFATYIARKKGYAGPLLVWAWIPLLNMYGLLMFIGLPDKVLHEKIDRLAAGRPGFAGPGTPAPGAYRPGYGLMPEDASDTNVSRQPLG